MRHDLDFIFFPGMFPMFDYSILSALVSYPVFEKCPLLLTSLLKIFLFAYCR